MRQIEVLEFQKGKTVSGAVRFGNIDIGDLVDDAKEFNGAFQQSKVAYNMGFGVNVGPGGKIGLDNDRFGAHKFFSEP